MLAREISVAELMRSFLDGIRALVPVFERAQLGWQEEDAYDPWEQTAETLFKAIVVSAIDFGIYEQPILPLPTYDARIENYSTYSYISEKGTGATVAFICFETDAQPFDTCLFALLDEKGSVISTNRKKVSQVTFSFVVRLKTGSLKPEVFTLTYTG